MNRPHPTKGNAGLLTRLSRVLADENVRQFEERQRKFGLAATIFMVPVCLLFTVLWWLAERPELAIGLGIGGLINTVGLLMAWRRIATGLFVRTLISYLAAMLIWIHLENGTLTALTFLLLIPLVTIFIFGFREGIFWSFAGLTVFIVVMMASGTPFIVAATPICVYGLMIAMAITFELLRAEAQREADDRNRRLRHEHDDLLAAQQRLAASESKFRTYAELASDFIYELDADLRFTYVSPRFTVITGLAADELIGRRVLDVLREFGGDRTEDLIALFRARESFRDFRMTLIRGRDDELHALIRGEPVIENGDFAGYLGSVSDISGLEEAQRELRQRDQQLHQAQKMEAIGELTSGFAHDVNNLLGVISGNLELVRHEVDAVSDNANILTAESAVDKAAELTAQLLSFARRQPLKVSAVDLGALFDQIESMLARTLGNDITVHVDRPDDIWPCRVDPNQLESALLNLALNARDAIDGHGEVTMSVRNRVVLEGEANVEVPAGEYTEIKVEDTGRGMSPDIVRRAVEPFFTTKELGRGTGLGLSTVYGFAKQSGGQMQIASEAGRGTSVTLLLPRASAGVVEPLPLAQPERAEPRESLSVLCVEDEPELRKLLEFMVRRLGHEPKVFANAEDALASLSTLRPDLLISDVMLGPGMNGADLADRVRSLVPGISVLLVSGYPQDALKDRSVQYELLSKPFNFQRLAGAIEDVLGQQEAASA